MNVLLIKVYEQVKGKMVILLYFEHLEDSKEKIYNFVKNLEVNLLFIYYEVVNGVKIFFNKDDIVIKAKNVHVVT